ncbi:MAG: Uma2 family endonuclease [Oscillatoria sp. PMC 1050.18]|nr:Uma2 family endonuclease [Oscillatoria sp. PMC 1050.18]
MNTLTLNLTPIIKLNNEQFEQLATANQDLNLELNAEGELIIMPPTGGETGNRNFEIYIDLGNWNRQNNLGKAFDSSTGFRLRNGATRSPDLSWITTERWDNLTSEQRKKFLPLCPDFAVELVSENDDLETTQAKMAEYLANGLRLGWLINPKTQTVEIYRPNQPVEVLQSPRNLSGENVLPGFILNLQPIWD